MEQTATLIFNFSIHLQLTDGVRLKELGDVLLKRCDYQVLNFMEHHFSPQGYTCIWLLGESHLAIHTFPESGLSYLELSSCNRAKNEQFEELLRHEYAQFVSTPSDI